MVAPHGAAWRAVAIALSLFVGLGIGVPSVAAYHTGTTKVVSTHVSETVTLAMNTYAVYTFSIAVGDTLTYGLTVTTGSPIDMYIVPPLGLTNYESDTATSFALYEQVENQRTIAGAFTGSAQNRGTDSVIVDNVDFSGAMASGNVTVTVDLTRTPAGGLPLALIGGILLAVIIVIALVAVVALRARKKRAMAPPPMGPPPYPGPPGPYGPPPYYPPQQPPQGPYPPRPPSP
jgi:hypothetical protein